jgi:prepilin-type N-terminal cleavage/methylation domain-containing protein
MQRGFALPELLVAVLVIALLAGLATHSGAETLARQRLEAAARRLVQGLEQARADAQRQGRACGLALGPTGWVAPRASDLPACSANDEGLQEAIGAGAVALHHNLPGVLRFSSNGLVLDGGTVVLTAPGTALRRCLVMALPLGVVRLGRYAKSPELTLEANACGVDASL